MTEPTAQTRRRLTIWMVVLVPFIVLLVGGIYYSVAQPGCAACHNQNARFAVATRESSHSDVPCVACHVAPSRVDRLAFGFREMFQMVLLRGVIHGGRDLAAVPNSRCLVCHKDVMNGVVSANGIRISHDSCARGAQCTSCHSAVAHGSATKWVRSYDMETCLACHASEASTKCDVCHEAKDRESRIAKGSFAVTHGKQWRTTHGMGNMATCSVCHTAAKCGKCHGPGLPHDQEFLSQHGQISADPAAKCFTCHAPHFCADCHGLVMPHPRAFIKDHSAAAKSDPKLCKRCHADPDCTQCHEDHVHPGGSVNPYKPAVPVGAGQ